MKELSPYKSTAQATFYSVGWHNCYGIYCYWL